MENRGHRTRHFHIFSERRRAVDDHVGARLDVVLRNGRASSSIAPPRVGTGDAGSEVKASGGSSWSGCSVVRRPSPLAVFAWPRPRWYHAVSRARASGDSLRRARRSRPSHTTEPEQLTPHRHRATANDDRTREARGEAFETIVPVSDVSGQRDRFRVTPRSDHQARGSGHVWARVAPDADKVGELARKKRIEPTAHQQRRCLKRGRAMLAVDRLPVRVASGMPHPVVEKADVAGGAVVGLDERNPSNPRRSASSSGQTSSAPRLRTAHLAGQELWIRDEARKPFLPGRKEGAVADRDERLGQHSQDEQREERRQRGGVAAEATV